MKKILLICNEVNNFFSLLRHLRDNDYDAHLFLMKEETAHFNPAADSYENNYTKFVHESFFSRLPTGFYNISKEQVKKAVSGYDFIIGCGLAPAYFNKIGIKLDLFIPYGSDLDYQPYLFKKKLFNKKLFKTVFVTYHQRMGIKNARFVMISKANNSFLLYYKNIKHIGELISGTVPFIYDKQYNDSIFKKYIKTTKNEFINSIIRLKKSSQFIIFHHCRHQWYDQDEINYKGNDKLIKGFGKFIQQNKEIKASLILFEAGEDVDRSKNLIKILNIEDYVKWFPVTDRKDIMIGISLCDVGVAEIGNLSWITYSTVCEFMCMSKPIIMYREDELYKDSYEYLYPILKASDNEDVASALTKVYNDRKLSSDMGEKSKKWFDKYVVGEGLMKIINAIESEYQTHNS